MTYEIKPYVHRCKICSSNKIKMSQEVCNPCTKFLKTHPPKQNCFICSAYMPLDEERYIQLGNMCRKCSVEVDKTIRERIEKNKTEKQRAREKANKVARKEVMKEKQVRSTQSFPVRFKTHEEYLQWYSDYRNTHREKIRKYKREYRARLRLDKRLKNKDI